MAQNEIPSEQTTDKVSGFSRNQAVYRIIRRAILDQVFAPGQKLTEDPISAQISVSRTLVREAFMRLSAEGLVDMRWNRGAYVSHPTMEEARHAFTVRQALERQVMHELAGKLTPDTVARLRDHIAKEEVATDRKESIRLAGDFHTLLADLTGNALLARYVREVCSRCSHILSIYGRPHSTPHAVDEHREILDRLVAGDVQGVLNIMEAHLDSVLSRALVPGEKDRDTASLLLAYARDEGLVEE